MIRCAMEELLNDCARFICECKINNYDPAFGRCWACKVSRIPKRPSSFIQLCSHLHLCGPRHEPVPHGKGHSWGSCFFLFYSSKRANRGRFPIRRRIRRILSASGGLVDAGGWGDLRIGRPVYIPDATSRLCRLGLGLLVSTVRPEFVFFCCCSSGGRW